MCAPCTLHSIRLQAVEKRIIQLKAPGFAEGVAAIRRENGRLNGMLIDVDGVIWMLVKHPERGLLGLPLTGEGGTWQAQWNNANIFVEVCVDGKWVEVDDWTLVDRAAAPL